MEGRGDGDGEEEEEEEEEVREEEEEEDGKEGKGAATLDKSTYQDSTLDHISTTATTGCPSPPSRRTLRTATEDEFGLGSIGMLRHIDSLLDECASVTDVVALVSVLTGNSRISVPDDIIFAFGDWEEQDARVAIDRLTQLHRWRRKGAKKMADEVNLARGKLRQHEEMVAPPVEVGVDLSAYFPYLSPFVKEAKGAHAVGGADKLAERWARLIRIAFDLGMADEAIVALLRGPARGVLSLISEMALLDHFESTAHTETSSEGVDQEKGEEEEKRAGGVGDEEGEAHQSHWLMVAAGLVSRHVTVRRRALWYWAL